MAVSLSDLPEIKDGLAFNQARWTELCADATLAALEYRIETDRFGHILMSPPPSFQHSDRQGQILERLTQLLKRRGRARPEIPLSTGEGVKAIDAGWISEERLTDAHGENLLTMAPEICVEVLSPSNTREEIEQKKTLYFQAGAEEVWLCALDGHMLFYRKEAPNTAADSRLCPRFPRVLS